MWNCFVLQELEQKKRDNEDLTTECEFHKIQVAERDKLIQVRGFNLIFVHDKSIMLYDVWWCFGVILKTKVVAGCLFKTGI